MVPVSVALKVGTTPDTALAFLFFRVIEMVDADVPSATTGPVPVRVEFDATTTVSIN